MDGNKKEGVSVKEIENFTKKHRFEVILCLAFVLACLFSFVFFHFLVLICMAVGGILGVLMPKKIENISKSIMSFVFKQEQITQFILAGVLLLVSIFLPFITFLLLALHGGKDLVNATCDSCSEIKK